MKSGRKLAMAEQFEMPRVKLGTQGLEVCILLFLIHSASDSIQFVNPFEVFFFFFPLNRMHQEIYLIQLVTFLVDDLAISVHLQLFL